MKLILASASPRRRELLRAAGIAFEVQATDIPEVPNEGEPPEEFVKRLALQKAGKACELWQSKKTRPNQSLSQPTHDPSVSQQLRGQSLSQPERAVPLTREPADEWFLGADTTVVVDGQILNKPEDARDAARMLRLLSGRWHEVITGVALVMFGSMHVFFVEWETTRVEFAELSEEEIASYVATGEPMDKAGAYAIQGIASRWIPRIEGDYANVVGLPVARVWRMLRRVLEHRG